MTRQEFKDRMAAVKRMRCIACEKAGMLLQCGVTEVHHLNAFGRAGMKRRGDECTIPLGSWHHRGASLPGWTATRMTEVFGPSLARNSREFRNAFGTDDDLLLVVDHRLQPRPVLNGGWG